eukprot:TRINITY_DN31285_c0_g1_i1.p2 TRINITY_DN31285_c0_g1~~TRINITY_DN31285_c0_g1_i1.p2  ORF type:complete len:128 (+),score=35.39 TRINITY_DN31285_c0_g1_i1:167-550(+)
MHSRLRARRHHDAKRRGRHTGIGKRHGKRTTRMSPKIMWIRRQRALRRLLRKYRRMGKLDKNLYHKFYMAAKGNIYKNKKVLVESIVRERNEKAREERLKKEGEKRRAANLAMRQKKAEQKAKKVLA